ncbi:MAG: hypothetical protein IT292_01760 [Deltaproteobacteria bacterium]|nr:hypothetical protein [Deltaproteobacteria bacterium]
MSQLYTAQITNEILALTPWLNPNSLEEPEFNRIRLSRGFLHMQASQFFENLASDWVPFFSAFNLNFSLSEVSLSLDFADNLTRVIPFYIDKELALLAYDSDTMLTITSSIADFRNIIWSDYFLDYLERRVIASLNKRWIGAQKLPINYSSHLASANESVEVIGAIIVKFLLNDKPCSFHFAFSLPVVDRLDQCWRDYYVQQQKDFLKYSEELLTISVCLPTVGIEATRVTESIQTKSKLLFPSDYDSRRVIMRIKGETWAKGTLCRFANRYAVKIDEFMIEQTPPPPAHINIEMEICRISITSTDLIEHSQQGAILLTGEDISNYVTIMMGGEPVANGQLFNAEDRLVLEIQERQ